MKFTAIDLDNISPPDMVKVLDYNAVLAELVELYQAEYPDWNADVESDPAKAALRIDAHLVIRMGGKVNDGVKACLITTATKADLENLVADFGLERQTIVAETDDEPAIMESDPRLRRRRILAPEALTNAGSVGAYMSNILDNNIIEDAEISTPVAGTVLATLLAFGGSGVASNENITFIEGVLNPDTGRPLTDNLIVQSVDIFAYQIIAVLKIYAGLDFEAILAASIASLNKYLTKQRKLGADIPQTGLTTALMVEGVERVVLNQPTADIAISNVQVAYCPTADIDITYEVADV